jgi:hypothetical protein
MQSKENVTLSYKFPIPENFTYDLVAENFSVKVICNGCKNETGEEKIPVNLTARITNFKELKITKNEKGVFIGAL